MFGIVPTISKISAEETNRIIQFIRHVLTVARSKNKGTQDIPDIIFHYTSTFALKEIVSKKAIHATHISFMNDIDEYRNAIEMFATALKDSGSLFSSEPNRRIKKAIEENLKSVTPTNSFPLFIACFSNKSNDLNQWRSYGGAELSFNIGMSIDHLTDLLIRSTGIGNIFGYLTPVIYQKSEKERLIEALLKFISDEYPQSEARSKGDSTDYEKRWANQFLSFAAFLAPVFKNLAFEAESEWRIVVTPKDLSFVDFKPKRGLLAPHMSLPIADARDGYATPIRNVQVGPSRFGALNEFAIENLSKRFLDEKVKAGKSEIPFRDIS